MTETERRPIEVVFVHGIRTSASMWRSQLEDLKQRGIRATAVDLPGHGTRMSEPFTLTTALKTIDDAVRDAANRAHVLLVGHSMGGLLSNSYLGAEEPPPVAGYIGAGCTALPQGVPLLIYRALAGAGNRLPDQGMWLTKALLAATLPLETRADFGAGGYALIAQDPALKSLGELNLRKALPRIQIPTWLVNGQYDQLRVNERLYKKLMPDAELIIVPRTTHLVTAMRPAVFNAIIHLAIATLDRDLNGE